MRVLRAPRGSSSWTGRLCLSRLGLQRQYQHQHQQRRRNHAPAGAVVFSGIQPTGVPHLGNYIGALRQWVRLQDDSAQPGRRLVFSIVDLHALTAPARGDLRQARRQMLAALLAVGLDPQRCTIFYQSAVPAHSELMWILSCIAPVSLLSRMTQWKSKMNIPDEAKTFAVDGDEAPKALKLGLFSYPVLQAADVLVHRATQVPVGEDQIQHLEFTREMARRFNATYNRDVFAVPQTITPPVSRIMSLQDPARKMSKSDANPRSRILLTDAPEDLTAKIMAARTDSVRGVSYDPEQRPGVANLLEILAAFDGQGRSPAELAAELADARAELKDLKISVAEAVGSGLAGIRQKYSDLMETDGGRYLDGLAADGSHRANESAEQTMALVRDAVGLT